MRNVLLTASLVLAWAELLFGQSSGTINGRVTDPAGAAIPGATVAVMNVDTGANRNTVTNAEGLYSFPALDPGTYRVRIEKSGFAPTTRAMTVFVGSTSTLDLSMAIAGTTQEVDVTTDEPLVETTQSGLAGTLATKEVQELPMLNRNFTGLVTLVPGARQAPILDTTKATMGAGIAVGGNEGRNLGLNVDGAENRDLMLGGPAMDYTLEGIQEFKLLAHNFGAQYPRSSGGVLEIATKSGTNAIHGSAFAFGRNQDMTAIDYFTQQQGLPKNAYDREQFGGSFGGPIVKNRWFYFGAVERLQQDFVETEPTKAYAEAVIVANALPSLGIQPVKTMTKPLENLLYTLKSDFQPTGNHSIYVRFGHQNDHAENDQIGVSQTLAGSVPHPDLSSPNNTYHHAWSIVASDNWAMNSTSVNQFSFQANHYNALILGKYDNPYRQLAFPSVTLGGYYAGGVDFVQDKYQVIDDLSTQAGAHALKVGGSFAWVPTFNIGTDVLQKNWTIFTDDPSVIVSNKTKYPQGFQTPGAAFLMFVGNLPGSQDGKTIPRFSNDEPQGFKQMGVYAQDDWRIASNLTLNLGFRYDLTLNGFDQSEASKGRVYQALKAIGSPYGRLPSAPAKDFQPRFGLAWNIRGNNKDVLRIGFGIFRDDVYLADVWQAIPFMKDTLTPYITYTNLPFLPPAANPLSKYVIGVGPLPPAPAADITQVPPGTTGFMISPDATDPYTLQYHAGYTHQITQNLVVGADFSHIQGLHEFRNHDINPIEGPWDPNQGSIPTGTRRLAAQFGTILGNTDYFGPIKETTTSNRSRYDELLFHVEHRGRRLTLEASYTLSVALAYGGITGALASAGTSSPEPNNPDQLFAPGEWGPTNTDELHRIVLSSVIQLPWGVQISPVVQAASARAYTLGSGADTNGDGVANRPLGDRWVDPATGRQVGVNSQRGNPTFDLDFRATKSFNVRSENRKFLVFAEVYNLTNKTNFGNAYSGFGGTSGTPPPNFKQPIGYLQGLPTSRQLQLGARFIF